MTEKNDFAIADIEQVSDCIKFLTLLVGYFEFSVHTQYTVSHKNARRYSHPALAIMSSSCIDGFSNVLLARSAGNTQFVAMGMHKPPIA